MLWLVWAAPLSVQVLTFRHPKLIKDVFLTLRLIVLQPLLGAVLLHSLSCNAHTTHTWMFYVPCYRLSSSRSLVLSDIHIWRTLWHAVPEGVVGPRPLWIAFFEISRNQELCSPPSASSMGEQKNSKNKRSRESFRNDKRFSMPPKDVASDVSAGRVYQAPASRPSACPPTGILSQSVLLYTSQLLCNSCVSI